MNYSWFEMLCHICLMLCVGFIEEVIFRGLLFRAIAKDNVKTAIIISSITFGTGHLLNLINTQRKFISVHHNSFGNKYTECFCK